MPIAPWAKLKMPEVVYVTTRPVAATAYTDPYVMPTISQKRIELKVTGLPAHDWTHTNTVNATTTMPAMSVRRVSGDKVRVRWTAAVMSLPPVCACGRANRPAPTVHGAGRSSHHAIC